MKVPDKIYADIIEDDDIHMIALSYEDNGGVEYIRKDVVDEMLKTAEDHAYFAGREKMREELLEWAKEKKQQLLEQESVNDEPSDVAAGMNAGFDMIIGKLNSM